MLGPDGQPLARKYYAEKTGKDLDVDEVVRGYEIDKEKYVIVTDEEIWASAKIAFHDGRWVAVIEKWLDPPVGGD